MHATAFEDIELTSPSASRPPHSYSPSLPVISSKLIRPYRHTVHVHFLRFAHGYCSHNDKCVHEAVRVEFSNVERRHPCIIYAASLGASQAPEQIGIVLSLWPGPYSLWCAIEISMRLMR